MENQKIYEIVYKNNWENFIILYTGMLEDCIKEFEIDKIYLNSKNAIIRKKPENIKGGNPYIGY